MKRSKYVLLLLVVIVLYMLYTSNMLVNHRLLDLPHEPPHYHLETQTTTQSTLPLSIDTIGVQDLNGTLFDAKKDFLALMESRISHKEKVCHDVTSKSSFKMGSMVLEQKLAKVVYYTRSYKFLWCPVFKAASTNWMRNIISLAGLSERAKLQLEKKYKKQPNMQARSLAPTISRRTLKTIEKDPAAIRMITVRHPFQRLLSAFRDKLERCTTDFDCTGKRNDWFYHRQGSIIVKKYRDVAVKKFGNDFFSEKNNFGAPFPSSRRFNARLPIWWEFIQHVLNSSPSQFDEHYRPAFLLCSTCGYNFNFIIKYENISTEEPLFIEQLGASDILQSKWLNSNKLNVSDSVLLETYFSLLTDEEIGQLYRIYQLDFQQFDYSFQFRGIKYN